VDNGYPGQVYKAYYNRNWMYDVLHMTIPCSCIFYIELQKEKYHVSIEWTITSGTKHNLSVFFEVFLSIFLWSGI
jgi:hypothetical protein